MDPENHDVAVPEEAVLDKVAALKLEAPEETAEPENPAAAAAEQPEVNGHGLPGAELPQGQALDSPAEPESSAEVSDSAEQQPVPESEPQPAEAEPPAASPEPQSNGEKVEPVMDAAAEQASQVQEVVEAEGSASLKAEVVVVAASASPEVEAAASASPEVEAAASASPEVEAAASASPEVEAAASASPEVEAAASASPEVEAAASASPEVEAAAPASQEVVAAASASPEVQMMAATSEVEAVAAGELAEADPSVAAAAAAAVGSELVKADLPEEEDPDPVSGSLSFALLERDETKDALRLSRTLVVLRGLPGSGKSFLARAIAAAYKDHCSIISADDHGIDPENPEQCGDGYRALDEAVVACCSEGPSSSVFIVVDDTNHTLDRLVRLGELAEQHHLVSIFLEPHTAWSRDPAQLSTKTRRGLEAARLEAMKAPLLEVSLPLYFGWFLLSAAQDKVRCMALDFVKTLDTLEAFKKHLPDFTGKAEAEVDLEHYFQSKGTLHCTTKFCNYGKADGAQEYAENQAVQDSYGAVSELSLSALFVTPRTVGARVSLSEEQLLLWPADVDSSLPAGSRAHVTLGCAEGVEPVQTGLDLLEIAALQQDGQQGETVEEMELGRLAYFGAGRWLLVLREPIVALACFSSYYGPGQTQAAKPEKKKKPKCAIL